MTATESCRGSSSVTARGPQPDAVAAARKHIVTWCPALMNTSCIDEGHPGHRPRWVDHPAASVFNVSAIRTVIPSRVRSFRPYPLRIPCWRRSVSRSIEDHLAGSPARASWSTRSRLEPKRRCRRTISPDSCPARSRAEVPCNFRRRSTRDQRMSSAGCLETSCSSRSVRIARSGLPDSTASWIAQACSSLLIPVISITCCRVMTPSSPTRAASFANSESRRAKSSPILFRSSAAASSSMEAPCAFLVRPWHHFIAKGRSARSSRSILCIKPISAIRLSIFPAFQVSARSSSVADSTGDSRYRSSNRRVPVFPVDPWAARN